MIQLYFATGGGADSQLESLLVSSDNLLGVFPVSTTTTDVYFRSTPILGFPMWDRITFTHANTTRSTGHRCKIIAKAIANACNASPHAGGFVEVVDADNNLYFGEIISIASDASFGIAITKGHPSANAAAGGSGGGKSL